MLLLFVPALRFVFFSQFMVCPEWICYDVQSYSFPILCSFALDVYLASLQFYGILCCVGFKKFSFGLCVSCSYIFTKLSPLARRLFPVADEANLRFLSDDNQRIEPEWYCPIIPMILVNGADGIGTGYSTSVPNFDVRDVVRQMRRLMDGKEPEEIQPKYKGFSGTVAHVQPQRFIVYGRIGQLSDTQLEISELPVRVS